MKKTVLTCLFTFFLCTLFGQAQKIYLWKDVPSKHRLRTKMFYYAPADSVKAGSAVLIFPGGSYHHLGRNHEGKMVAEWFRARGVAAFVVHYRTAGRGFHHPAMIEDFQRALQMVRENATAYGIDAKKVGAIGFSAGGHLVTMGAAFADTNFLEPLGIATHVSLQPDWIAPIYPVVSMQDSIAHRWSRKSLTGTRKPTQAQKDRFSLEQQIPDEMPPIFLQCSKDDDVVDDRNSLALQKKLREKGIEHQFYLYETGGHGYGMKENDFAKSSRWQEKLQVFLIGLNMVTY